MSIKSHNAAGKFSIYTLRDPCQCDVVRYVGMTSNVPERWKAHKTGDIGTVSGLWTYSLKIFGRTPIMDVVEIVSGFRRDAVEAESSTIVEFRNDAILNEPFFSQVTSRSGVTKRTFWIYRRTVSCYRSLARDQHKELKTVGFLIDEMEDRYPALALVAGENEWRHVSRKKIRERALTPV